MYATATKRAKEAGDTSKSDKRYAYEDVQMEAKVDTGKSPEEKEKVRNVRKFGVSHNVSGHGKLRRSLHRMNRGDKKIPGDKSKWMEMEGYQRDPEQSKKDRTHSKQPDPSKDGFTGIGNMSIKDIMRMNARMKKEKKKEVKEDKALAMVKAAIIKKHGKGAIYDPKNPPKPPTEAQKKKNAAERKKRQDADNKAYAARAKKAGFKSTQDYTNVVARYGSEDNYRKGKGLGT